MAGRTVRHVVAAILIAALWMPSLVAAVDAPVADAAMRGDAKTVRHLLERGTDVNAAQGDGMTALHWAAMNDDLKMVEMLVYAGANVKASTRIGAYTPLFMASRAGDAAIIGALLDAGADPNRTLTTGATPLMPAAASGSGDAVAMLLDHGADVNATESAMGQTALMFAAAFDRPDAIEALMRGGADADLVTNVVDVAAREKAARDAGRRRQARVGRERQEREAEEKARADAARAAAGEAEPAEGAEEEGDARQRQGEGEPRSGQGNDRGGEDGKRNPFLRFFAWIIPGGGDKRPAAGPQRLTYGQLVGHQGGLTALHFAARQGHLASVRALLNAAADVNAVSGDGSSPLLVATINGRFDLAMYLLQRGADPNRASDGGATPLYGAINVWWAPHAFYPQPSAAQEQTTHLELMQRLLDTGADADARITKKLWYTGYNFDQSGVDERGSTAFWRAAQAADLSAMRLLLAAGADSTIPTQVVSNRSVRNSDGFTCPEPQRPIDGSAVTPLQAASGAGYDGNYHRQAPGGGFLAAVKFLVEQTGGDVNLADDKGLTPLHNAALRGDNEMIRYLVSEGADLEAVDRRGRNVSDWANGPIQRLQPFTETLALLAELGAPSHNDKCVSC